jgi:cytochrome b
LSVSPQEPAPRLVWDLPVRVFHWLLVLAVIGSFVTDRIGVTAFRYHVWCGYTVLVLVAFRIVWGLVGTRHARFGNFVRGPRATLHYLLGTMRGRHERVVGHNPLGALMVVALLLALAVQAVSGLFGNDEIFNLGPLYGYVSKARSLQLTSLHRRLFYWIAGAVGVHVLAVLVHRLVYREDLVRPMLSGHKSAERVPAEQAIAGSRVWLAVAVVLGAVALLAWIVVHAPEPADLYNYN